MGVAERTVAGWILEKPLGSGGFGEVWRARRRHVELVRALKIVPLASQAAFDTWRHEIGRLEALSHPNIVRFYDADVVAEGPYADHAWIATELCEHSLADQLRGTHAERLTEDGCEQLVDEMLAALAAAHDGACVHRDVKPANILRHSSGAWKLCDFGTARLIPQGESHPHTTVVGTSPYMSAAAHRGRQDQAADLYALGVTVHEALCGKRLHPRPAGITDSEYIKIILDTPPVVSADLPRRWQTVVEGLTAADGTHRPAQDLYDWFRHTGGRAPLPPPSHAPTAVVDEPRQPEAGAGDRAGAGDQDGRDGRDQAGDGWGDRATVAEGRATVVQPTAVAEDPSPPFQQVFVPAPNPAPAPQPVPAPAPVLPAHHHPPAPPAQPSPPVPPAEDRWQPTKVTTRRFFGFVVDAALVWFVASAIWMLTYGAVLLLAYDRVGSGEVDDAGAFCREQATQGVDCRVFRGDGRVYVRDSALWTSEEIAVVATLLVVTWVHGLRQGRTGATPGKRLAGIRVTGPDGAPPGRGRALVRTALLPVDVFAWPVMLLTAHLDRDVEAERRARRRLGDRVANTWVVRQRPRY